MNLQTSTLKFDETGEPLHIQQAARFALFAAWKEAGHVRSPRVSVSRSIFALINDQDRAYFGRAGQEGDTIGFLDETTRAVCRNHLVTKCKYLPGSCNQHFRCRSQFDPFGTLPGVRLKERPRWI